MLQHPKQPFGQPRWEPWSPIFLNFMHCESENSLVSFKYALLSNKFLSKLNSHLTIFLNVNSNLRVHSYILSEVHF